MLSHVSLNIFIIFIANYFKAAYIFSKTNMSGTWLWNLLGTYSRVLEREEDLEYNAENESHILCVCVISF